MTRARRNAGLIVVLLTLLVYIATSSGHLTYALSADNECMWSPDKEALVMGLLRAVYGESIEGYAIDSVKLVSYGEEPLTCTYRVALKNRVTNAELLFDIYEMFGKVTGYRMYLPPVERLRTVPLGEVSEEGVFRLTPEALREIDRFLRIVREVLTAPSLGDAVINLSEAVPDGLVLGRGFVEDDNEPFRRGFAEVRLGRGLTAEIVYLWNIDGMDSLMVHIFKNFTVGPGAEVKYYVIGVQFFKVRGEWVPYGAHAVPFPLKFDKVSTPPSTYLGKAEEAALQKVGTSCKAVKSSFTEAWAMSPPKLVNGSLYLSSITYVYDMSIDCGDGVTPVRVLVDASNGSIKDVSVGMTKLSVSGEGGGETSPEIPATYLAIGTAPAAAAVIALAVLRRRARAGH